MRAVTWHQSGGEPWAFSVSGQHHPQVLKSMEDPVRAARDTQPSGVVIRIGLTGLPGTPRSVTATMFTPCSNIASAARRIAQVLALCTTSTRSKEDPNRCAIAAYHGSWERPGDGRRAEPLVSLSRRSPRRSGAGSNPAWRACFSERRWKSGWGGDGNDRQAHGGRDARRRGEGQPATAQW
jgi:hypothetical protein